MDKGNAMHDAWILATRVGEKAHVKQWEKASTDVAVSMEQ